MAELKFWNHVFTLESFPKCITHFPLQSTLEAIIWANVSIFLSHQKTFVTDFVTNAILHSQKKKSQMVWVNNATH